MEETRAEERSSVAMRGAVAEGEDSDRRREARGRDDGSGSSSRISNVMLLDSHSGVTLCRSEYHQLTSQYGAGRDSGSADLLCGVLQDHWVGRRQVPIDRLCNHPELCLSRACLLLLLELRNMHSKQSL